MYLNNDEVDLSNVISSNLYIISMNRNETEERKKITNEYLIFFIFVTLFVVNTIIFIINSMSRLAFDA